MKDEEKAKEIAHRFPRHVQAVEYGCLLMAAWKEQQIIKWLKENACTFARINANGQSVVSVDNMIISLKQAMEGE